MDLNSEKVNYHIQSLLMFLNIAKDAKTLAADFVENTKQEVLQIFSEASNDAEAAVFELNRLIEKMNAHLTAPYPILMTDTMENLVKGEIAAFEHFLNQELKANHLSLPDEASLFNDSLHLWEKIGVSLTPHEGIVELGKFVQKVNYLLPDEEKYPFPDADQY